MKDYEHKAVFYANSEGKFIKKHGIKWCCGRFTFYLLHEKAWMAFEARSGCQVFWNRSLESLKKDLESIAHTAQFSEAVEKAIRTTGVSPLYEQLSLFK